MEKRPEMSVKPTFPDWRGPVIATALNCRETAFKTGSIFRVIMAVFAMRCLECQIVRKLFLGQALMILCVGLVMTTQSLNGVPVPCRKKQKEGLLFRCLCSHNPYLQDAPGKNGGFLFAL